MLVPWFTVVASAATGPFAVGWQDRVFDDPVAGTVPIRVYYPAATDGEGTPADPTDGPFPLAGFLHGWLGSTWMYDGVCTELASWGWVVTSVDTETGLVLDMNALADDGVAMLHAVQSRSDVPGDLLAGLVSDEDWTLLGHSMGGATLGRVLGMEPRIRTAVSFMPYQGEASFYDDVRGYDGALLLLSGTNDTTAPPALQQAWMEAADRTSRSLLVRTTDMGHKAVTDLEFGDDPMPDALQLAIVSTLASTFVRAEQRGEEDLWAELLAPTTPGIEQVRWSRSHVPALAATLEGDRVTLGIAGLSDASAEVFFGTDESLADGVSVAALDLPLGVGASSIDVPASWQGDLWVGVRTDGADGEVWTRAIGLVVAPEPEPEPEPEPDVPATGDDDVIEADEAASSGGCATTPGTALGWMLLLPMLWRRRA